MAAATSLPPTTSLPVPVQRYVLTGAEPSPILRDLTTVTNQVPRWAYATAAGLSFWMAWKAYKLWKLERKAAGG